MPDGVHLEGLMHLAALSIAVTGGYIGLDRINEPLKSAFDALKPEVTREHEQTQQILTQCDLLKSGTARLQTEYGIFWQYLICTVVDIPCDLARWRRAVYFFRRQKHIPLLIYFRKRWDLAAIVVLLMWSLVTFMLLVAGTIWEISFLQNLASLHILYATYVAAIAWVLFTLFVLHSRLSKISATCEGCRNKIRRKMRDIVALARSLKLPESD